MKQAYTLHELFKIPCTILNRLSSSFNLATLDVISETDEEGSFAIPIQSDLAHEGDLQAMYPTVINWSYFARKFERSGRSGSHLKLFNVLYLYYSQPWE